MKLLLNAIALAGITCSQAYSQALTDSSQALNGTSHVLKEVAINAGRFSDFTTGNKIQHFDSAMLANYPGNNLGDLLAQQSQVFIKSYGPGMLATTSFRGATAEQTAILWNGFNLQSPMNAQLDLALVPIDFVQNVKLQYGGSSALFGSGAIGGTIHLDNSAQYDKGITIGVQSTYGSFGSQQQSINIQLSEKNFISSIKIFDHTAQNDFPFVDIAQFGNPTLKEPNAQVKQSGIMQENYYKINKRQEINLRLWYENTDRNLPPSMTESDTSANQKDISLRITSEWKRIGKNSTMAVRAAWFDEQLNYMDPLSGPPSLSHSKCGIAEAEDKFIPGTNQTLNIGLNNTYTQAYVSDGYMDTPHQNRTAVFCSYRITGSSGNWDLVGNAREEQIDGSLVPFTPYIGFERKILKWISLYGNASRNYRVPSFNDLYWVPGGNPALKPESGWSEEAGLNLRRQMTDCKIQGTASAFNSLTHNLITWVPTPGSINWHDANIDSVWSRGLEFTISISRKINRLTLQLSGMYDFVLSTSQGEQLIYVPIQNASCNFSIFYKKFSFNFNYTYTGYRYETSDNKQFLYPYQLGNAVLSKMFNIKNTRIRLFARVNNIWNDAYQVIAWYAMPMRNYQAGISIDFNKAN
jgi:vitamin B12 transporter